MDRIADQAPDPMWDLLAFRYHDVCIRYCNHTADMVEGKIHRQKALKIYDRLSPKDFNLVRSFHELLNRISIWDANEFAFERANVFLEPLKALESRFSELFDLKRNQTLGKICGSMGQNDAFLGWFEQASSHLEITASHLGRADTLQNSYRAHLALDQRKDPDYFAEMALLFKLDRFPGFSKLVQNCLAMLPRSPSDFNLHLILKGMLIFPPDATERDKLAVQVHRKVEPWLEKYREAHPWELIWTTLGRLLSESGDIDRARRCWGAAANFTDDPNRLTFIMIGHSARAWEALSFLEEDAPEKARLALAPVTETFLRLQQENIAPGIFNPNRITDEDGVVREGWFDQVGHKFLKEMNSLDVPALASLARQFLGRFTFNYW